MAENTLPKKNVAYTFYVGLVDTASRPSLRASATLAAGDVQASTDGGAFGNLGTLPVVTPAAGVAIKVDLSTGEMNGDNVTVKFIDAAGNEWDDLLVEIRPGTRKVEDLAFPTTTGRSLDILATGEVAADLLMMGGVVQSATDLKDFADAGYDPSTDKVTGVLLVDTVTTNVDLVTAAAVNTAVEAGQVGSDTGNILTDTGDMQPKFGTMVDLGSGAFIGSNLSNLAGPTFASGTDSQENIRNDIAGLNNIDGSGVTLHAGIHSGATIDGALVLTTYTGNTLQTADVANLNNIDGSGVTLHAGVHSGATIDGVLVTVDNTDVAALNDIDGSGVTLHAGVHSGATIDGALVLTTYTGNTLQTANVADLNDIDGSEVTLHAGTHSSVTIQGVSNNIVTELATDTVDAVALASDAVTEIWAKTVAELSQGAPSPTPTALNALALISMGLRNKVESSSTQKTFFNDAGVVIWKKAIADDSTTYTEAEGGSGP